MLNDTPVDPTEGMSLVQKLSVSVPFEVVGSGCKCTFCDDCAVGRGLTVRTKLKEKLKSFKNGIMMLTFTLDPKEFENFEAGYRYANEKRAVARTIKVLYRLGYLKSREYFSVLEFQESGNPHWHVLVHAKYVHHGVMSRVWNSFGPNGIMGYAFYSDGKSKKRLRFEGPEHAANYACKYIIKPPKHDWPSWVLDAKYRVRRFSSSRGFFAPETQGTKRGKRSKYKVNVRTIRERVSSCKETTVLLFKSLDPNGNTVKRFAKRLEKSWSQVCEFVGEKLGSRRLHLKPAEAQQLVMWGSSP